MNLNMQLDGEEEQPLQYVNSFAFNIPPAAATFNVNIINPALTNQSYILNPMNPVGQSIVAYQPPVALQSYIAYPPEAEGNIIHSLPVGMPVPVGLPVSTGLLQNNFVNTGIIIGNEDCNTQGDCINPENEIKINYIEKPVEFVNHMPNGIEVQNVGVNCLDGETPDGGIRKPCPLEMSIRAANIDSEFEKSDSPPPKLFQYCTSLNGKHEDELLEIKAGILKVPLEPLSPEPKETEKKKTEITWENNNKQESTDNGVTESLICEVEEANDDDDDDEDEEKDDDEDDDDDDDEEEGEGGEEEEEEEEDEDEDDEDDDEESEKEEEQDDTGSSSENSTKGSNSSDESDSLPLSVAFRRDRLLNSKKRKRNSSSERGKSKQKKSKRRKKKKRKRLAEKSEESSDWSESDDDVLNLKRIKNEFDYKYFFESKLTKMRLRTGESKSKKFVRVRSCCLKRECGKKISSHDQKAAYKHFISLETNSKKEAYLMNCIEHVQKHKQVDNAKDKEEDKFLTRLEEDADIQLEIENESNGNQKLSDEIQKAINESLKDCAANESREGGGRGDEGGGAGNRAEGTEKKNWNFYIVIDRCRKKVCLQFLLKLFQIPKSQIRQLQKKALSGSPLAEDSNQKADVWELAKEHLNEVESVECLDCKAQPRHRFFSERPTKEELFNSFKDFHIQKLGKGPNIKYASYKRFLEKKTSLSFCEIEEGICTECEEVKRREKRKQSKLEKSSSKSKKGKKSLPVTTDSEYRSSDDEPLSKRKKRKLATTKSVEEKTTQKRNSKKGDQEKGSGESKSKGKSKQSGSRGRDVWSLMLLHLETKPFKECKTCVNKKKHRFLDPSLTAQGLYDDYRKYFLKETNSELGLGFTMYEKYFNKNCNYLIGDVDVNSPNCPGCAIKS